MTPMLKQYFNLKDTCKDAVLFFRMGDFYEIFGDDAVQVAPKLEVVLTSREKGDRDRIPFCGVPHHSARNYWLRLLGLGYKVAIADQMENPAQAKGLVRREITRILSPGCVEDIEALEQDKPNFLMGFFEVPAKGRSALVGQRQWAIVLADISTGELRLGNLDDDRDIVSLVERHQPREILLRKFEEPQMRERLKLPLRTSTIVMTALPESVLRDEVAQGALIGDVFGASKIDALPCGKVAGGKALVGALFEYLKSLKAPLNSFLTVRPLREPRTLEIGETVLRDLEIFETARRRDAKGSLFAEINHCRTAMGSRFLRRELAYPSVDRLLIEERRQWIAQLLRLTVEERKSLADLLLGFPDIQRLATRIFSGHIYPGELAQVRAALARAERLVGWVDACADLKSLPGLQAKLEALRRGKQPYQHLAGALSENPGNMGTGLGVFETGFDSVLDECTGRTRGGADLVSRYEIELRERSGIASLKIRDHQSFGLLIEVTRANASKVPSDFIRRQTMVNGERFVTPELTSLDQKIRTAQGDAIAREAVLYQKLLCDLHDHCAIFREIGDVFAEIDFVAGLALAAHEGAWCPPKIVESEISLEASRHPVVERAVGRHSFVPNRIELGGSAPQLLLTGPNMGGKSTVMRQVAIAAILNQIGSYVPAQRASLPIFDRVFTRVGAGDDLASGQSTFMVEMFEAATILRQATARSLVILDEVGRGTSTGDGLAIASGILQEIAESIRCITLFATHYHELVDVARELKTVRLGMMEAVEKSGTIIFTHRLIAGAAASSFGLEVARLAGVPERVLQRARLAMNNRKHEPAGGGREVEAAKLLNPPLESAGLKCKRGGERQSKIIDRLMAVRIHSTTPLQALNILDELRAMANSREQQSLFQ